MVKEKVAQPLRRTLRIREKEPERKSPSRKTMVARRKLKRKLKRKAKRKTKKKEEANKPRKTAESPVQLNRPRVRRV